MAADALPQVSVVLPTYNGSRYLAESIQSVIDQTFEDWELIIVDDCSTDETPQIIERFVQQDPRICCIRHETNRKLPAALNTGFSQARGDYFTWTSDDNRYAPEALQVMLVFLQENPGPDMVYCDYSVIGPDGVALETVTAEDPLELLTHNVVGACLMYSREVALRVGAYDTRRFLAEDYDYWLRLSLHGKLAPLHHNLYFYRQHANSLTSIKREAVVETAMRVLERHLPRMTWAPRPTQVEASLRVARAALERRRWGAARRFAWRALHLGGIPAHRGDRHLVLRALLGANLYALICGARKVQGRGQP